MKEKELKIRIERFIKDVVASYDLDPLLNSEGAKILNELKIREIEKTCIWTITANKDYIKDFNGDVVDFVTHFSYHKELLDLLKKYLVLYSFDDFITNIKEVIERKEKERNE